MKLQYLTKITSKTALPMTRDKFFQLIQSDAVEVNTRLARQCLAEDNIEGYRKAKGLLPAVQWVGRALEPLSPLSPSGERAATPEHEKWELLTGLPRTADALIPTQLFMIDIDHMTVDPREAWEQIKADMDASEETFTPVVVHVTPSGKGLRIVSLATRDFSSVKQHMDWLVDSLGLTRYGDYDSACKDLSRCSFIVPKSEFIYIDEDIFEDPLCPKGISPSMGRVSGPIVCANESAAVLPIKGEVSAKADGGGLGAGLFSDDSEAYNAYRETTYHGRKLTEIVDRYIEEFGKPEKGEIHNHYNQMVKYFRCICDNNPRMVHAILPRFGSQPNEFDLTWSQCKSICRQNTVGRLPREFWLFLYHNGFLPKKETEDEKLLKEYLGKETEDVKEKPMPPLPPVFREFCATAPDDFKYPVITALMPILGTLASNFRADDYDGVRRSTTFFNVIYAPAGSGKSFAERMAERLLVKMRERDEISSMRELIYLKEKSGKAANNKDPEDPHVSTRIMPAINSQPEFLQKMRDNKGYHMFTFAEEVDSFNKGTRGGGSDKSDLFRIGWDNGRYGQSFKSAATFKGMVNIYYNFLLTGTPNQVKKLYSNVEDGMVTRVSFAEIANQEFAERPHWKKMSAVQKGVIDRYIKRMDDATYVEALDFTVDAAYEVSEKDFDTEVPWRYTFRPFTEVDMSWIFKPIDKWNDQQRKEAVKSTNIAHDLFRRRTAQKGFRLALLCYTLWTKVTKKEQTIITDFVLWWMDKDLRESLKLFEEKVIELNDENFKIARNQSSLFDSLPETFTKEDVVSGAMRFRIKTRLSMIISRWKAEKLIRKEDKNVWKKIGQ